MAELIGAVKIRNRVLKLDGGLLVLPTILYFPEPPARVDIDKKSRLPCSECEHRSMVCKELCTRVKNSAFPSRDPKQTLYLGSLN